MLCLPHHYFILVK